MPRLVFLQGWHLLLAQVLAVGAATIEATDLGGGVDRAAGFPG